MTKEWFDLRKDKLLSAARGQSQSQEKVSVPKVFLYRNSAEQVLQVYYDALSKKSFNSESKYVEYTNSNKYKVSTNRNGVCFSLGGEAHPMLFSETS